MSADTDLLIAELGLQAAAYRGLKAEISPVDNGVILEMLDGSLRDMTDPENRRFEVLLTTDDVHAPAFMGLWKGSTVTIDLPIVMIEPVGIAQVRPAAPGSLHYLDAAEANEVPAPDAPNRGDRPAAAFRAYRPRLRLMLSEPWKITVDEWEARSGSTSKWREVV